MSGDLEQGKWYEWMPPFSWITAGVRFLASFSDVDLEAAGVMRDRIEDKNVLLESPGFVFPEDDPRNLS